MQILQSTITFDRFVRGLLLLLLTVIVVLILRYLSPVLIPFFAAWAVAWMLVPMVDFFQHRLHLHYRLPCVIITLVLTILALSALAAVTAPIFIEGFVQLKEASSISSRYTRRRTYRFGRSISLMTMPVAPTWRQSCNRKM